MNCPKCNRPQPPSRKVCTDCEADLQDEGDSVVSGAVCPKCGAEVQPSWKRCPECETELGNPRCAKCGQELKPHWKRCPECNTQVVAQVNAPVAYKTATVQANEDGFNQLCVRVTETLANLGLDEAEKVVASALSYTNATPPAKTKIWGEGFFGSVFGASCWAEISSSGGWRILKWKKQQSLLYVLSSPAGTYRWQSYKEYFLKLLEYVDGKFGGVERHTRSE